MTFSFQFEGILLDTTTPKTWKIKVSQIECDNPNAPDKGCHKWLTGASGNVKSYNFGQTDPAQVTSSFFDHMVQFHIITVSAQYSHLTGRFRFCLRQERGYCTTRWSVNTADASPFSVSMVVFYQQPKADRLWSDPCCCWGCCWGGGSSAKQKGKSPCMV